MTNNNSENAISYALAVIASYDSFIKAGIKDGTIPDGFCQGSVFESAPRMIKDMKDGLL